MKTNSIPFRFVVVLLAGLLLLVACQPPATATPGVSATSTSQPEAIPTVSGGVTGDSNVVSAAILLDPALAQDTDSFKISQYLYDGLVRLDVDGKVQPALAESWIISDDQLDYIFTIRSTAVFSDGTPITPDVIVDNFNRWFDPVSSMRANGDFITWKNIFLGFHGEKDANNRPLSPVDGIQKVDFNTVLIHLNRPVPDLLTDLANPAFAILNPDTFSDSQYGHYPTPVISSGPYVVSSWTETILVLTPNPKYWSEVPPGDMQFTLH
jgi:peptide/nickel transport system substrate-binding protein